MKRYIVRPYNDYKSWGYYETIEEAKHERNILDMSFFSRNVAIINNNTYKEVV